ncbi:putative disease resistance protein At3g14460 isoform X3 [Juglans microcarpa x Juglans regia]|uniref:putative disease resistance protein At3g14460 isoform X3 n=1 Tax=Juglans microcarpa x Juglans regia TaxID=2249226 RepID=UPI001B7DE66E|nr:putative disease resistance protein At3g14460 isoform X3 [Juglans microcarpa x Juglans regia]
MVSLEISNCRKCTLLPPLGQLPSLETLLISGMDSVKSVGSEFCGNNCAQCFRSLKTLRFENMKEWEKWSPYEEFPNLRKLFLYSCPKLLGKLPNNIPLPKYADIYNCAQLKVSLSYFPDKCTLNTERSSGVVCGNKVTFKSRTFYTSLSAISDQGVDMEGLAELENLSIENCEELTTLWSDKVGSLPHDLPFLHHLNIYNCPKLVSLVEEEVDQERLQLKITSISIKDCIALESLPKALMYNNTCLQSIEIINCDSLMHFARSHLPPTLKKLRISVCKSMRNLVEDDDNDTNNNNSCSSGITSLLEDLSISNCPSLEFLTSSGELPTTLQRLEIFNCPKLESVAKSFHHNSFLTRIYIYNCENLQLFNGGELLLPSNLRQLYISKCEKVLSFPKEGFPTNLTVLVISHLKITEALFDWELDNLTSLNELRIVGCQHLVSFPKLTSLKTLWILECENLACFPEDGLPPSLLELDISNCEKLRSFPKNGLPPSLLKLCISDCQNLRSFPKDGLPSSLLNLRIFSCKKLRSFPKNGLPPSLQQLAIDECPLLEEWCKKGEWCKIADIPYVEIDDKYIYGTETEE